MTTYRKGDVVLVEAIVDYDQAGDAACIRSHGHTFYAPAAELALRRAVFKAFDRVSNGREGTIIHVDGVRAWVSFDDGDERVVLLDTLERLDESPE